MGSRLPLFPLGTVLFPGLVLPLHVFEERYRALVRHLTDSPEPTREFGVVAIRRGWEVQTPPAATGDSPPVAVTPHEIGCTAQVRRITALPDGSINLVAVGGRRFRIVEVDDTLPYLTAEVEWLPEPPAPTEEAVRLAPQVLERFREYLALLRPSPAAEPLPDDPTALSYTVAAVAVLSVDDRQALLAAPDAADRLRAELRLLSRELILLPRLRAVPAALAEFAVEPSPN